MTEEEKERVINSFIEWAKENAPNIYAREAALKTVLETLQVMLDVVYAIPAQDEPNELGSLERIPKDAVREWTLNNFARETMLAAIDGGETMIDKDRNNWVDEVLKHVGIPYSWVSCIQYDGISRTVQTMLYRFNKLHYDIVGDLKTLTLNLHWEDYNGKPNQKLEIHAGDWVLVDPFKEKVSVLSPEEYSEFKEEMLDAIQNVFDWYLR